MALRVRDARVSESVELELVFMDKHARDMRRNYVKRM